MKTLRLDSWNEFDDAVRSIEDDFPEQTSDDLRRRPSPILYRGQKSSKWLLETTLERYSNGNISIQKYFEMMMKSCDEESLSFSSNEDWESCREKLDKILVKLPCRDLAAHLRHYRFPSPLLDWTKCPSIALFFALQDWNDESLEPDFASVFAYIETPHGVRGFWVACPKITTQHWTDLEVQRHKQQQSEYTIATEPYGPERWKIKFVSHVSIYDGYNELSRNEQDVLIEIRIPREDRAEALSHLASIGIDDARMFDSK